MAKKNLFLIFVISLINSVYMETYQRPNNLNKIEKNIGAIQNTLKEFNTKLDNTNVHLKNMENYIRKLVINKSENHFPQHCNEIQSAGQNISGIYTIQPKFSESAFLVWCDMETKDGGWTYILNRFDGDEDFDLEWKDYRYGFGNLAQEFWLGLENLHQITGYEENELLIELIDWDSKKVYAHYDSFSISDENNGYAIKLLGVYRGDAGDSFSYHAGMKFTTKDKDQDRYKAGNCAEHRGGGWWYKNCVNSHLTGKYLKAESSLANEYKVLFWEKFHGPNYSLKEARMMVRPKKQQNDNSLEENEN